MSTPTSNPKTATTSSLAKLSPASSAPPQPVTAFKLADLALPQDFDAAIGLETHVHSVPLRKPNRKAFCRVHPAPEYRLSLAILRDELGEMYAVHPQALPSLADEVQPMMVYTCIDEAGNVFLWPVGLPGIDGRSNDWWKSAHAAAAQAQREWVRVVSDTGAGHYKTKTSKVDKGEPAWPTESFEGLLNKALGDGRLIDSANHPVVRRLNGEA